MSGVCPAITRSGERCTQSVKPGFAYCHRHAPALAEERRRAASRAGRSKPNREIADVKARLSDLAEDVLSGEVDKSVAAVAAQVLNVYLRAVSVEIRVKEAAEFEERVAEIEAALGARKGGSTWG